MTTNLYILLVHMIMRSTWVNKNNQKQKLSAGSYMEFKHNLNLFHFGMSEVGGGVPNFGQCPKFISCFLKSVAP